MAASSPPRATYRLQFSRDFTFRDAERLIPYLHALGISHIYASPYLKARAGSTHGYDITDYSTLNPEIGETADFDAMVAALARHDMGHILDVVPNHMGVGRSDNAWWLDVLEWGQASPYASYFDIGWNASKAAFRGKLLLPFLGDHYGVILEAGQFVPSYDEAEGSFSIWYHEHRFPLAPQSYSAILMQARSGDGALADLATEFRKIKPLSAPRRALLRLRARCEELKHQLAQVTASDPQLRASLAVAIKTLAGVKGDSRSFVPLHRLLERQHYRLAYWRVAADEINYRRFFDINELAGIRVERSDVFDHVHALVLRLFAEGKINGLRIDHIDGLFDPRQYCRRLHERMMEVSSGGVPPYLLVEKILAQHESLPADWAIDGATGYGMLNLINGLFVDSKAERAIDRAYRSFVGQAPDFDAVLYECKKHVMDNLLAGELEVLAVELDRISEESWRTRDFTLASLKAAIREVVACFPVYRTYVTERGASAEDRRDIDWAVAFARRRSQSRETTIFDFVHDALTIDLARERSRAFNRRAVARFAMKFQQFTGPVMAKAMEDTAFYRYTRLLSLNEVGGDPRRFGTTVSAFHHLNQERVKLWPRSMVTTATHDTKRGEDVRARLNVLSELPEEWGRRLRRWSALNRIAKTKTDGTAAPSAGDEYLLYQTLVGTWPIELLAPSELSPPRLEHFRARINAYMIKAVREAKLRSNWATPNEQYETLLSNFVNRLLDRERSHAFLSDLQAFATRVALPGMINSLGQTVLKLTTPGVPDIYQGCEMWDLNLVDPDNRRPVDFAARASALSDLTDRSSAGSISPAAVSALIDQWTNGRIKLHVLAALLAERGRDAALFADGIYVALDTSGLQADNIIAFARVADGKAIAVIVPRLVAGLCGSDGGLPIADVWTDGTVVCPTELADRSWTNILTGESVALQGAGQERAWKVRDAFRTLPLAALVTS